MIHQGRFTTKLDQDCVVFLIGMRINKPYRIDRWAPVIAAMPRMLKELHQHPELGFLGAQTWLSRTIITVQYWRTLDQLLAYAKNRDAEHLPAWRAFNRHVQDDSVGIWHETYAVAHGGCETMYVNMPPFGLGKAFGVVPATGSMHSARSRLGLPEEPSD